MAGVFVGGHDRFRSWKTRLPVTFLIFVIGGPILGYFVYSGIMTGSILFPLTVLYLGHLIVVMVIYVMGGISATGSWLIYNIGVWKLPLYLRLPVMGLAGTATVSLTLWMLNQSRPVASIADKNGTPLFLTAALISMLATFLCRKRVDLPPHEA